MSVPIRRDQFRTADFLAYLAANGAEVGAPTNPYEVVRYKAYWRGTNKAATHVVYAKENGILTFTGGSMGHYRAFLAKAPMEELPDGLQRAKELSHAAMEQVAGQAKKPASKSAVTREKLLARDGDECWFCGEPMGDDMTIEHLVPKAKGGRNMLANYALAHRKCNNGAADMPLIEKIALRERMRSAANA